MRAPTSRLDTRALERYEPPDGRPRRVRQARRGDSTGFRRSHREAVQAARVALTRRRRGRRGGRATRRSSSCRCSRATSLARASSSRAGSGRSRRRASRRSGCARRCACSWPWAGGALAPRRSSTSIRTRSPTGSSARRSCSAAASPRTRRAHLRAGARRHARAGGALAALTAAARLCAGSPTPRRRFGEMTEVRGPERPYGRSHEARLLPYPRRRPSGGRRRRRDRRPRGRRPALDAPLAELLGRGPAALQRMREIADSGAHRLPLAGVRLAPPVQPRKFFAIGLNYADHVAETGAETPEHMTVFIKASSCVTGPYDPVERPAVSDFLDYEGELGIVIGRRCRHVRARGCRRGDRGLPDRRRRQRSRLADPDAAVVAREVVRHPRADRAVDRHRRRARRPARPRHPHLRERRAAAAVQHPAADLRLLPAGGDPLPGVHAGAGRRDRHRHAVRDRRDARGAAVAEARRPRPGRGRRDRRHREPRRPRGRRATGRSPPERRRRCGANPSTPTSRSSATGRSVRR